ncbi:hypothetical protein H1164_15630 [Thermoactinomyces daqus]|uniref:Uncharacterized protein n=1 Tax=Thermoactinomyces daqus TaxID=1329516 RepID=A0A7W1XCY6_9BACL|nr:hypothetical protein [Thermoactinomyces daqus]MBA4544283.1 hypothetical protein [Thermoactinomyces daqus]
MSWLDVKGPKGDWTKAKPKEHLPGGFDWFDPKSQPVHTLWKQPAGKVTPSSFFTKLGSKFLGLK